MNHRPSSWLDRLVGACFSLLVGAATLYFAARLIESVWVALVVILLVTLLVGGAVALLRTRRQGW